MVLRIALMLLAVALTPSLTATQEAGPSMEIQPGQYPAHAYESPPWKQQYRSYAEFFDVLCALNPTIGCDPASWTRLSAGTTVTLPAIEGFAAADSALIRLERTNASLESANTALRAELTSVQARLTALEELPQSNRGLLITLAVLVPLLLIVASFLAWRLWGQARAVPERIVGSKSLSAEYEVYKDFVDRIAVRRPLPDDGTVSIVRDDGLGDFGLFEVGLPRKGEPTFELIAPSQGGRGRITVMQHDFDDYLLNDASDPVLEANGYRRVRNESWVEEEELAYPAAVGL